MKRNLYICYTYYHIYISILEIFFRKKQEKSENYLIIADHIFNGEEVKERLEKYNFIEKIYFVRDLKLKRRVCNNFFYCIFYRIILGFLFKKENKELYKDLIKYSDLNVNMFLDSTTTSHFFMYNYRNLFLVEEGMLIYCPRKKVFQDYLYFLLLIPQRVGRDKRILKIRIQYPERLPEDIIQKGERLNLQLYINKLNFEEKKIILNIFGFNEKNIEKLKEKKNILYTQPLSEDGTITEKEKIELYSKIIKNYKEETLVIKQHPKDKTDYKKIFPDIEVLDQNFPAELFSLLDMKFEKAITLFSTAVLSDKNIKIDFYGTEVHPKILKRFGRMEHIMQTNAFIKEKIFNK